MKRPSLRAVSILALAAASSVGLHVGVLGRARPPLVRSDAALVDEANRVMALRATQTIDLGAFFLRAERGPDNPHLQRWADRKVELGRIGADLRVPVRDRVDWIVGDLFRRDALGSYIRESSNMSRFFDAQDRGGNCEAETKLVVSALLASGLDLTGPFQLGVQVFDDHVQPVLLDRKERMIWSLVDGAEHHEIQAPVYDPAILLHAWVSGLGRSPSVAAADLLILAPRGGVRGRASAGYATDTKLDFPPSGVRHSRATAPDRTTLPVPNHPRAEKGEEDVFRTNVADLPIAPLEAIVDRERCPVLAAGLIRVRDPAEAAEFNRLGSYASRARYVLDLSSHTILSRTVPSEPLSEALKSKAVPDLLDDLDATHTVVDAAACGREAIEALGIAMSVYRKQPFSGLQGALRDIAIELEDMDEVKTARWRLDELQKFAADHPRELAHRLSRLPHRARVEALTLLAPTASIDRVILPLVRSVSMDDKRKDVAEAAAKRAERPLVLFDVYDASETTVLLPAPPAPLAPPPPASEKEQALVASRKAMPVPVEVYVDLVAFTMGRRHEAMLRDRHITDVLTKVKAEVMRRQLLHEPREWAYRQGVIAAAIDDR